MIYKLCTIGQMVLVLIGVIKGYTTSPIIGLLSLIAMILVKIESKIGYKDEITYNTINRFDVNE